MKKRKKEANIQRNIILLAIFLIVVFIFSVPFPKSNSGKYSSLLGSYFDGISFSNSRAGTNSNNAILSGKSTENISKSGGSQGSGIDSKNKDYVKFSLFQGEVKSHTITLSNAANTSVEYYLEAEALDNFITYDKGKFSVAPHQEKGITMNMFSLNEQVPGVYFGRIFIKEQRNSAEPNIIKVLNYLIEINSKNTYFNIIVKAGELNGMTLPVIVDVKNVKAPTPADISLEIYITDINNEIISSKKERLTLRDSFTIVEQLSIEPDKPKEFIIYGKIRYNGEVSVASTVFGGVGNPAPPKELIISQEIIKNDSSLFSYVQFIIILFLLIAIIYEVVQNTRILRAENRLKNTDSGSLRNFMKKQEQISRVVSKEENDISLLKKRLDTFERLSRGLSIEKERRNRRSAD